MKNEKMEMDCLVSGKSRQTTGLTKSWKALMGVILICGSTYVAAGQSDNPGKGKRTNPTLTVNDLAGCKNEIAELHRLQINFLKNAALEYCTKPHPGDHPDNCKNANERVRKSSAMTHMSWYMKGNESCESPEYPCWGLQGMETMADLLLEDPIPPSGDEFGDYGWVTQICVAKLWVAKRDGKNPASLTAKQSGNKLATNSSPATSSKTAGTSGGASLSSQQVTTCTEEIKNKQIESQSWGGDVDDVAARLGQFQKSLFEGRCAGHPEAQAYIAGANKMIGYGGNAAGSGGSSQSGTSSQRTGSAGANEGTSSGNLTANRRGSGGSSQSGAQSQQTGSANQNTSSGSSSSSSQSSSASPQTDRSRTRKVHNPAADAKGCVQLIKDSERKGAGTSGNWRFWNNCNGPVEVFWCFTQDNGSCREGGTWTVSANRGWPTFGNKPIKWGACRGKDGGGMDNDSDGGRYTCHLLKW